jgi:hypothetical protein
VVQADQGSVHEAICHSIIVYSTISNFRDDGHGKKDLTDRVIYLWSSGQGLVRFGFFAAKAILFLGPSQAAAN